MVRAPLARAVSGSDFLNSVSLYLPHYNEEALDKVIEYLTDPDPEIGFPTKVQKGENLVALKRNAAVAEVFGQAQGLPTYRVEKVTKQSNSRRLLKLGRALAWDKLDHDAGSRFVNDLVAVLAAERQKVEGGAEFTQRLADAASIDIRAVTVAYGATEKTSVTSTQLAAVAENVDAAFADAGRKLGGGLHAAYLQTRAGDADAPSVGAIKLELYALLDDETVGKTVEKRAGELLAAALEHHKVAVRSLSDERKRLYRVLRMQADKPAALEWELPDSIERARDGDSVVADHLYVDDAGTFGCKLNGWEKDALGEAMAGPDAVAWLRNDPRKEWSLTVPYNYGGHARPMYPDFVVFRRQGGGIVADILEPHALAYEDSVAKAKGLAAFAQAHGDEFGRIDLLTKFGSGTGYKRLELNDIETRTKVLAVDSSDNLKLLFEGT
jgi:type III restriction enzyme